MIDMLKALYEKRMLLWVALVSLLLIITGALVFHQHAGQREELFQYLMNFLINIVSAVVITLIATLIYKVSDTQSIITVLSKLDRTVSSTHEHLSSAHRCVLASNALFEEVTKVRAAIGREDTYEISDFIEDAEATKRDSRSSIYVLPLTRLTYKYFVEQNPKWLQEEKEFLRTNPGHSFRRIVIIDPNLAPEKAKAFLKRYASPHWKVIPRNHLQGPNAKLFRQFCVFELKDGKKKAYFTYLDKDHHNLFTKGSWTQYITSNEDYIGHLEQDFNRLLRLSHTPNAADGRGSVDEA